MLLFDHENDARCAAYMATYTVKMYNTSTKYNKVTITSVYINKKKLQLQINT